MEFGKIRQFFGGGGTQCHPDNPKNTAEETERCILCGEDTGIPCDTPIAARKYYISGSGQLCERCYAELYIRKTEDGGTAQDNEMQRLIDMCKVKRK